MVLVVLALGIGFGLRGFGETPAPASRLIIPGKSIGELRLGPDTMRYNGVESDYSEGAMGGKEWEAWYLGARHGEKGRPFHRPDEIGTFSLKDMEHDSAKTPGKVVIKQIYVTSPKFATADGIAPGSTLDSIFAKYPGARPGGKDEDDSTDEPQYWPLYGEMEFYRDGKDGIAFAIQKSSGLCIQVCVVPRGKEEYVGWSRPFATEDYMIDTTEEAVGSIKLGMNSAEIVALLGRPDQKVESNSVAEGSWWKWRLPPQRKEAEPGFTIYMRRLHDGRLAAFQIRVSSPAFTVTDRVFPGCPLKDALEATGRVAKIDGPNHMNIYADLFAGLLLEVRPADSVCTAISIFPAPVDYRASP